MEITDKQQEIYNQYLKAIAEVNNRPYNKRKDFTKFKDSDKITLKRLELFFNQYKHINPYMFFKASLEYKALTYIPLADYLKFNAISCYNKQNKLKYDNCNSEEIMKDFEQGLRFILTFCSENNCSLKDYKKSINPQGVPWPLIHLKEQNISFYHIHALDICYNDIKTDYVDAMFSDFENQFNKTKNQFNNNNELVKIRKKIKLKEENKINN